MKAISHTGNFPPLTNYCFMRPTPGWASVPHTDSQLLSAVARAHTPAVALREHRPRWRYLKCLKTVFREKEKMVSNAYDVAMNRWRITMDWLQQRIWPGAGRTVLVLEKKEHHMAAVPLPKNFSPGLAPLRSRMNLIPFHPK